MKLFLTLTSLAFALALPTEPTDPEYTVIPPLTPTPSTSQPNPAKAAEKKKYNEICGYPGIAASLFQGCEKGLTCLPAPCRKDRMGSAPDRYVCTTQAAISDIMCLN
ncbi:ISWI chromatin-remodeling complex ATPase [Venturia inaequalis]|nr:ISWI chromatin-remodeling complex ATPase [Venturia inaequalis]